MLAVLDQWVLQIIAHAGGQGFKGFMSIRVVRLLRVARMLKVLKMRKDLLVLLEGVASSIKSMMPIAMLLGMFVYAMSLVMIDIVQQDDIRLKEAIPPLEVDIFFGNLGRTALTLFCVIIGDGWGDIVWPMCGPMPHVVLLCICFVMLCSFGILNVIVGIVCERVAEASKLHQTDMLRMKLDAQMLLTDQLVHSLTEMDSNHDNVISLEELDKANRDDLLSEMVLPEGFTHSELLRMVDEDGNGRVRCEEFGTTMLRLVHCDEFQRTCLNEMHSNDIKAMIRSLEKKNAAHMDILGRELRQLHAQVLTRVSAVEFLLQPTATKPAAAVPALPDELTPPSSAQVSQLKRCTEAAANTPSERLHNETLVPLIVSDVARRFRDELVELLTMPSRRGVSQPSYTVEALSDDGGPSTFPPQCAAPHFFANE